MVAETEQEKMKEEEDAAQHSQPAKELTGKRSEMRVIGSDRLVVPINQYPIAPIIINVVCAIFK